MNVLLCTLLLAATPFDAYITTVESHLNLHPTTRDLRIEHLPTPAIPNVLLHHWRATAFAPGAHAADLDHLLRDIPNFPHIYAPQVLQASILNHQPDHLQATLRVRQKHILTVVLDTTYDITFAPNSSTSRSTHIAEVDAPDHGFLLRQNTYWTWEERDNGLYLQVESVSLTRSIPRGLAWAVAPFVDSIPRESLEFTLHSTLNALRK